jgi:formate hydrogenlyase subunit 4
MSALGLGLHLAVGILLPPFLLGIVNRVKAILAGRTGQPLLQPYYDLARLFRKGMVFSDATTFVFRAGPAVGLATALLATTVVPFAGPAPVAFAGDVVLLAYLFALSRFFTVAAALDTGSSFEGMGASREVTFAVLAEPALFLALLTLCGITGSLSLSTMLGPTLDAGWSGAAASLALVTVALFIVLLAENSRIPVDDPTTHLELTMIHEVMVLDHSGPALGMILYGAAVKLLVFLALVARIVLPATGNPAADWALFVVALLALAAAVGLVESVMARLKMSNVPLLLVGALLFAGFALVLHVR